MPKRPDNFCWSNGGITRPVLLRFDDHDVEIVRRWGTTLRPVDQAIDRKWG